MVPGLSNSKIRIRKQSNNAFKSLKEIISNLELFIYLRHELRVRALKDAQTCLSRLPPMHPYSGSYGSTCSTVRKGENQEGDEGARREGNHLRRWVEGAPE